MKRINLLLCFVLFVCVYLSYCNKPLIETMDHEDHKSHSTLLNIYGEPLQPCRDEDSEDRRGSWNSNGYCDETGDPISIKRLEARPVATLSLEAQEMHEKAEKRIS